MEMKMESTWVLTLTTEELRLICKALGGRLTDPDEIEQAKRLDLSIAAQRITKVRHLSKEMDKLEKNIKEEQ